MFRSAGAVFLGFLTYMVLIGAFDFLLLLIATGGKMPHTPEEMKEMAKYGMFFSVGNTVGGIFHGLAAGYVVAWVARRREVLHACVIAGIAEVMGVLMFFERLGAKDRPEPLWYLVVVYLIWPLVFMPAGGMLRARHVRQRGLALDAPVPAPDK